MKKYINTGKKTKLPSLDNMILYLRKPEEVCENQLERVILVLCTLYLDRRDGRSQYYGGYKFPPVSLHILFHLYQMLGQVWEKLITWT